MSRLDVLPRIAALALVAALFPAVASPAQGAVPAENLIKNPGAETGTPCEGEACQTTSFVVPVPGWTTKGTFTLLAYGRGPVTAPSETQQQRIRGGKQFFAGGFNGGKKDPIATASQTIGVAGAAKEIDLGIVRARLSAAIGSCGPDTAALDAVLLDAAGADLGKLTIGPVSGPPRFGATDLSVRSTFAAVPKGTRSIRVVMTATHRLEGSCTSWNDAYFDNLSLTLTAER
ncbi:MAG: hypothetical protein HY355_04065 [Armatimonadetes bacterium]|nr:hypothetical protein [Armatimonadota bacterium]